MLESQTPPWLDKGLEHIWLPYAQMKTTEKPMAVKSTQGVRINLDDGRSLIDGVSSWWTAVHGYNHPHLLARLKEQLQIMPHVMLGGLAHEEAYTLATRLASMTPGSLNHVFFTESGSVAVEVAMKIAVQYWRNLKGENRPKFLSFKGGYHGDTFGTMAVCDPEEGMHHLFNDALMPQYVCDLPKDEQTVAALEAVLAQNRDIAALVVEPLIQGAGGMQMFGPQLLQTLRSLCTQYDVLLIFDEVFTGFGRTGALFGADKAGIVPDIMTLGKALTGGVTPLAATIATQEVFDAFYDDAPSKALMHGPTFCGHALGCAAANASLDLFEQEPRLAQVQDIEHRLKTGLSPLSEKSVVRDVRIAGAVGAVELDGNYNVEKARARFIERGTFIRPLGRVIYLSPSYVMDGQDLDCLIHAIHEEVNLLSEDETAWT